MDIYVPAGGSIGDIQTGNSKEYTSGSIGDGCP